MKKLQIQNLFLGLLFFLYGPLQAVELQGHAVQGGLMFGVTKPASKITLDNINVPVGPKGHFAFGLPRDANQFVTLHVTQGKLSYDQKIQVHSRVFDIEYVDGLPPNTVSPPPEWAARRKLETDRVRIGRTLRTDDLFWFKGFIQPAKGRFSGFYGSQRVLNGKPRSPHYGLDIANDTGTPIIAPAGGKVTLAASDFLLEGGIVIIDHGFGLSSTLFHMNRVDIEEGQIVQQGQQIGTIGARGRASGPHVDWRINWGNDQTSVRLDPGLVIGLDRLK